MAVTNNNLKITVRTGKLEDGICRRRKENKRN